MPKDHPSQGLPSRLVGTNLVLSRSYALPRTTVQLCRSLEDDCSISAKHRLTSSCGPVWVLPKSLRTIGRQTEGNLVVPGQAWPSPEHPIQHVAPLAQFLPISPHSLGLPDELCQARHVPGCSCRPSLLACLPIARALVPWGMP
jgi:hypothetical protein